MSTHPGELTSRSRDAWPLAMLREARGERLPRPMAVVFPRSTEDVSSTLAWAVETGTAVVPRGGGSGLTGAAQAAWRGIVLDLSFLNRVVGIDRESRTVEVEAGTHGDRLEAALGRESLTLGHDPQSLSFSSVGGWIASSSAGHASAGFGTIADLVLGLEAVLAGGEVLQLPAVPSAGPDLRRLLIGSEGTLAVITRATLAVAPLPHGFRWSASLFPGFDAGIAAARDVAQSAARPLVLRLFDDAEAASAFDDLGHEDGAVLLLGFGEDGTVEERAGAAVALAEAAGGRPLPEAYGERWWDHRYDGAGLYRRIMGEERMLGPGVVVDTLEVEALWSALPHVYGIVRHTVSEHAAQPVTGHLTHPRRSGATLSFGFLLHGKDDQAAEARYLRCWEDAARACREAGGSLGRGVGLVRAPFIEGELGTAGLAALRAVKHALDPHGVLNPGKLLPG